MADTGVTQLDGIFKEVYAGAIENLVPQTNLLADDIAFVPAQQREGNTFNQPVQMTRETGWTFNSDGSTFTLNDPVSAIDLNASVAGTEFVLRTAISYAAMQKALEYGATGGRAGARAFVNATRYKVQNMVESSAFARELHLLYGGGTANGSNIGTVTTAANPTFTISTATWSTGIWSGLENAELDCYNGTTQINTNAALVVSSVDAANYQITLTGNATDLAAIAATHDFYLRGSYGVSMSGIDHTVTNTGTLHGISAATYDLWSGSSYAVGGSLTFAKLLEGLDRPAQLGFRGKMCAYVNPATWQDLNDDEAALRRYVDEAGGKLSKGAESLSYYGQTGVVELKPHILVKRGEAFALPPEHCMRVGATDITFEMPDGEGRIFRQMTNQAGIELRSYFLQTFFTPRPAYCVKYTGITNSSD